jgi:phospholipid/cholesterol/gamma-HCH transport system permease protein
MIKPSKPASITIDAQNVLHCAGSWTLSQLNEVLAQIPNLIASAPTALTADNQDMTAIDSGGAWVLCQLQQQLADRHKTLDLSNFKEEQQSLLALVKAELKKITPPPLPETPSWLFRIGKNTLSHCRHALDYTSFFGEIVITCWRTLKRPRDIQWRAFLNVIDETGFQALAIVALLCFLIGVVLAYQTAQQLQAYGANVYVVPLLGIGILQEFGPLITAIIVAGRTSSAFTAQIGSMQVNEEIDALRTMGLSPVNRLVLPKVFGLLVSLPLLVIWADIFGLLGGIVVSNHMLNIGFYAFLNRLPHVVNLSTFFNGLMKAPVFAIIISSVGCFHGFQVAGTADSVGRQTTKSVVQAIFMIIIADAIFSIIQPWQSL